MGAEPVKWTGDEIKEIVRDYIRDNLTVSVDMVDSGEYYVRRDVPRVIIYLGDEEISRATAY